MNSSSFTLFNDTNSSLQVRERRKDESWVGAGEAAFDEFGNLWITNSYNKKALSVRKANGDWKTFDFSNLIDNEETAIYDIAISNEGYKWITLPKRNEIIVFDDNNTIDNINDDRSVLLIAGEGSGDIPGNRGIKIEKDKNGLIWIGTSDGIAVHFNTSNVFSSNNRDFSRVIFFDGENNEVVLQGATIKDIAIDGANRKWVGTENSGVLLLSEDGKETIFEFTEENSPLPSNTINAIAIDDENGVVYIATSSGLVSYQSDATTAARNLNKVRIFPNPVRESYTGPIIISGLMDNSTVKITDVRGNMVTELKSNGGTVSWDGKSSSGRSISSGIFLVFTSAPSGLEEIQTNVGKIMFIR